MIYYIPLLLTHSSRSLNDRWGVKDDQTLFSIPLCPQPFEGLHTTLIMSILLIYYLPISFFCLPFTLSPCTVPCRIIFASPVDIVMCPYHLNLRFLTVVIRSSYGPIACLIIFLTHKMIPVGDANKSAEVSHFCTLYLPL